MESSGKVADSLYAEYENFILIGDFNATEYDASVENFCDIYSVKNLIKEPTYFKRPHTQKCIDLMMTNRSKSFQNSYVIETGLSNFHKMNVIVLLSHLPKLGPQIIKCRGYKNFSNEKFQSQIKKES